MRWQAAGLGMLYGGVSGFSIGSHIDRRISRSGRSPDDAAAALLLLGTLGGAVGGYMWGKDSLTEPGRLAFAASATLWGGVLTATTRSAFGMVDDSRSSLLIGTTLGVAAWHLWDDVPMARSLTWTIDIFGAAGLLVGAAAADEIVSSRRTFDETDEEEAELQQLGFRYMTGFVAGFLALGGLLTWAMHEPTATATPTTPATWRLAPQISPDGARALLLSARF